jgi:hypothetical protein
MRSLLPAAPLLTALVAAAGCPAWSGDESSVTSSANGGDAGDAGGPGCPVTLPQAGSPCVPPASPSSVYWECEYGTDPHCTSIAACGSPAGNPPYIWVVFPPDSACGGNPATCPTSFSQPPAVTCALPTACFFPQGACYCASCTPTFCSPTPCADKDAGTEWQCAPWPERPGCPNPRPLLGTPCSSPNQLCNGPGSLWMLCADGYWGVENGGC